MRVLPRKEWEFGMDFIRLANPMVVLYPKDSEEKGSWTPCSWQFQGKWEISHEG